MNDGLNGGLNAGSIDGGFLRLPRVFPPSDGNFALALHGGASDLADLSGAGRDAFARRSTALLADILDAGASALAQGATALDVAEAAVIAMEDSGLLNAGCGSARNRAGEVQMDAALMEGAGLRAGAVALVSHLRNPIGAARLVMEHSPHVLLSGVDAERFAMEHGAGVVDASYFCRSSEAVRAGDTDTVGAVVCDLQGNLAAAASTGGIAGKLPGRIGDSPLPGAGTYADNAVAAVSCTGMGEYFMRLVLAHELVASMRHGGLDLGPAAVRAIRVRLGGMGGRGGLIAVSPAGEVAMEANTAFMPRGFISRSTGARVFFAAP